MSSIQRLYLIDDDKVFNVIHSKIIMHTAPVKNIHSFEDAGVALEKLRDLSVTNPDEIPDMILLDINMPEMDGWAFLEEFENLPGATLKKCSIYLLTSSIDPSDIEKSKTYQVVSDFISKPLTPDKIHILFSSPSK
jgi:CheY-like chemotaxis protein